MIRQSPDVPAAVELIDVSTHIMQTEFRCKGPGGIWQWQSPIEFNPGLKVVVAKDDRVHVKGGYALKAANLIIVDYPTECHLYIPAEEASQIKDDPYIDDFLQAFRQYRHGRSALILPSQSESYS